MPFEIAWVREPNGIFKSCALILSILCLGFAIASDDSFFTVRRPPTIYFVIALIVLPNNVFALLGFILGYVIDDNAGFCFFTEVTFDILHGLLNLLMAVLGVVIIASSDEDIGVFNYLFVVVAIILAIFLFLDAVWYIKLMKLQD